MAVLISGLEHFGTGVRVWILMMPLLVLAGCTGAGQVVPTRLALPSGHVALPDHSPCEAYTTGSCVETGVAVQGTLEARDGCVWLVLDTGQQVRIVWPYGYSAEPSPFTVYDNSGAVVVAAGDRLLADGAPPTPGPPDACGRTDYVVLSNVTSPVRGSPPPAP